MRKHVFAGFVLVVVVAATLFFTVGSQATGNLTGHWTFDDGTASDSSGSGNHGLVNGAVLDAGKVGPGALDFDGVDDFVDLGNLDPGGATITLAAWINADNLANCGSSDCRIASKASGTGEQDHNIMLSTISSGGGVKLRFRLKAGGATTTLIASSGNLTEGQWTHVAATYDGANMRLFKDGIQVGVLAKTGTIDSAPAVPLWIGGNPDGATSRPWDGKIDDVRLYDGALRHSEIAALAVHNTADGLFATVGGGKGNQANGDRSTIGGGGEVSADFGNGLVTFDGNRIFGLSGTIGGGSQNTVGVDGHPLIPGFGTVGGGVRNAATGNVATVAGGDTNEAAGSAAFVGGGDANSASGTQSTVGGGAFNEASGGQATIGGGIGNTASGAPGVGDPDQRGGATVAGGGDNTASGRGSTIGGGNHNEAAGEFSFIGGGLFNITSGSGGGTIGGGYDNAANGFLGTVAGGELNQASGRQSTVGGGGANIASGQLATVAGGGSDGGEGNTASGDWSAVGGGENNEASGTQSTVGGGAFNVASGDRSTVPGGIGNTAGGTESVAAGAYANVDPEHTGAIVLSTSPGGVPFDSQNDFEFAVQAAGGIRLLTGSPQTSAHVAGSTLEVPSAGSVDMTWTQNGAESFRLAHVVAAFAPAGIDAITIDAISTGESSVPASSLSFEHTTGAGNDRILVVTPQTEAMGSCAASSVTYNGTPLTKAVGVEIVHDDGNSANCSEIWYLVNPGVGTFDVEISWDVLARDLYGSAMSLVNAVQQAPEATASNSLHDVTTISTGITTLTDGALVVDGVISGNEGGDLITGEAGQTERYDLFGFTDPSIRTGCRIEAGGGDFECDGDLVAGGYTQLDVTSGAPPAADCDEASEYGRMKVDADAGVSLLYICTADGWVGK